MLMGAFFFRTFRLMTSLPPEKNVSEGLLPPQRLKLTLVPRDLSRERRVGPPLLQFGLVSAVLNSLPVNFLRDHFKL